MKQQVIADEWVAFKGGELEAPRPRALCPTCREAMKAEISRHGASGASRRSRLLCFECFRVELARVRALKAAGELDTASDARFQSQLPFEPVNHARLEMLKAERAGARTIASAGAGQYVDKRRHAQIQARHALQAIAAGLKARGLAPTLQTPAMASAIHAAEAQLPEAWLPYVMRY
jgi:hypothetical protein